MTERRLHCRFHKASVGWYYVLDGDDAAREGLASGFDISRNGIGIVTARVMTLGTRILFHMRTRGEQLTGIMRVMRCRSISIDEWEVGLHIEILPPDQRELIRRWTT